MDYQTITLDITDGLAVLTLNRPDKMNALSAQMRAEITHAMRDAGARARAVVMTGAGRAFCTGQDLGDAGGSPDLERVLRDEYVPMLETITNCPVPTIAAVNGPAAGAGANLALSADVVIATESAYFLQVFTRIGLIPDAGGTWFMPRQMGMAKAMGASLFADRITARQADDWGMIWEAVADDAFEAQWRKRAEYLATGPTKAFTRVKQSIRDTYAHTLAEQLEIEAHLQGECGKSRDFQEGVMAFLQKRPASFEGR
ncbi:enoyl-CoA hydratase-related protein [Phaeobacter marinintestinus]|uniref:enoyl-CoA hydratase-related protein n=1 Tax=Falsiphaeobacter marinintestinus TaxID=1492905 RepID=UPI0011B67E8A|nr:enoyl-CoA hydratase-related protein [Phaeobacter marinintestinus]